MTTRKLAITALLVPLLVVAVTRAAVPAETPIVVATTRSTAPFHDDVFITDAVSATSRNLTRHPASDRLPVASPDGRRIAFVSDRSGGDAIWVVSSAGGLARRISRSLGRNETPWLSRLTWRPDGDAIAYEWSGGMTGHGVGIVTTEGRTLLHRHGGLQPTWLPGNRLAVPLSDAFVIYAPDGHAVARRQGALVAASPRGHLAVRHNETIDLLDPAGRRFARVRGFGGSWSPDGGQFAVELRPRGISLVDGRGRIRLLSRTLAGGSWAPHGRALLARDEQGRPIVVGLDGKTRRPRDPSALIWSPTGALAGASARGIVVEQPGGKARVVARLPSLYNCDARIEALGWVDGRRLVHSYGGGGQNDADLWLASADGRFVRRVTTTRAWEASPAWSPDGRTIAYESGHPITHGGGCGQPAESSVRLVSATGRDLGELSPAFVRNPTWSPDGRAIALERGSISDESEFGLVVVDVATRVERRLSRGRSVNPSWSPDSTRIVFEQDGRIRIVRVSAGESTPLVAGTRASWSPAGEQIAYVAGGRLRLTAPNSGEATDLGPVRGGFRAPLWAPDGTRLALGTRDGLLLVEPSGSRRLVRRAGEPLAWSPSGDRLLFAGFVGHHTRPAFNGSARFELFLVGMEGPPRRLSHELADLSGAAWRP